MDNQGPRPEIKKLKATKVNKVNEDTNLLTLLNLDIDRQVELVLGHDARKTAVVNLTQLIMTSEKKEQAQAQIQIQNLRAKTQTIFN